jgi:hypothetical protein
MKLMRLGVHVQRLPLSPQHRHERDAPRAGKAHARDSATEGVVAVGCERANAPELEGDLLHSIVSIPAPQQRAESACGRVQRNVCRNQARWPRADGRPAGALRISNGDNWTQALLAIVLLRGGKAEARLTRAGIAPDTSSQTTSRGWTKADHTTGDGGWRDHAAK